MKPSITDTKKLLIRPLIRFVIGWALLLIARNVVQSLPMIEEARFVSFPLSPLQIATAVVNTVGIVLVFNLGREIGNFVRVAAPRLEEIGGAITMAAILASICVAFNTYKDIGYALLGYQLRWVYPLIFLGVAIAPVWAMVKIVLKNLDRLTDATVDGVDNVVRGRKNCPNCDKKIPDAAKFCPSCGQGVPAP